MLWVFLLLVTVVWMLQRRWLTRRQAALAKQLKTKLKTYPIFGHSLMFVGNDEDRMKAFQAFGRDAIEAGGVSKILHFNHVNISVADPAVAEVVLSQCLGKHHLMKVLNIVIGNASIMAPVPIWRHRRKIDAPLFKFKKLKQFVETFYEQSIVMVDLLEKEANKGTFSFWEYIVIYSMNTVCETTMGVKIKFNGSHFIKAVDDLWATAAYIVCHPWFRNQFAFRCMPSYNSVLEQKRTVHDFITKIINDKEKEINGTSHKTASKTEKNKVLSFLDLQLEDGVSDESKQKYSQEELLEETLMLLVAGYDTTATAAGIFALLMGRHHDVQDKVYEELQGVFGDSDRGVTYEDLHQLTYLGAVIKETMRLYPVVPVIGREADNDVELPSGITLVKGCGVMVNIWAMHRNPAYWGADADQFRPERFLDSTLAHPAAFMPFSYGPRNCVGFKYAMLLLKTVLSSLLRRYRVLAPPGVAQGEPLRTQFDMLLRHVDNYEIRLERRE